MVLQFHAWVNQLKDFSKYQNLFSSILSCLLFSKKFKAFKLKWPSLELRDTVHFLPLDKFAKSKSVKQVFGLATCVTIILHFFPFSTWVHCSIFCWADFYLPCYTHWYIWKWAQTQVWNIMHMTVEEKIDSLIITD